MVEEIIVRKALGIEPTVVRIVESMSDDRPTQEAQAEEDAKSMLHVLRGVIPSRTYDKVLKDLRSDAPWPPDLHIRELELKVQQQAAIIAKAIVVVDAKREYYESWRTGGSVESWDAANALFMRIDALGDVLGREDTC